MSETIGEQGTDDSRIGNRLGKYHIARRIGRGGMGVVYEAEDAVLKRRVAIKVLSEADRADSEPRRRLLHEAQAAARLNHPNVVTIHEVGRRDDVHFIVMELVDGGSAQDFLEEMGPFNWLEATRVVADACRGLVAAHAAGLIHRDIKPANIMRSGDGVVKLADFGLAKITDRPGVSISGPGGLVGTPHYMSPEQCRFDPVDDLSDVYSLGATYFALIIGKPPYPGELQVQVMYAHCSNPVPDPRELDSRIPQNVAALAMKAMAKRPEERFASAAEMLAALEGVLRTAPKTQRSPASQWRRVVRAKESPADRRTRERAERSTWRRPLFLSAAAGFVLVIVAAFVANLIQARMRPTESGVRPETAEPALWKLATRDGLKIELDAPVVSLAIAPDGRYLVVRECDARSGTIRVWDLLGPGPAETMLKVDGKQFGRGSLPLVEAWKREGRLVAFSPDGGTVVTGSLGAAPDVAGLAAWPVADRPQQFVAPLAPWSDRSDVHAMAFSPDGLLAVAVRLEPADKNSPDLFLWDGEAQAVIARDRAAANMISSLAFSADGMRLATAAYKGPVRFWEPHRKGKWLENKRVPPDKSVKATGLAFAPAGRTLATVSDNQLKVLDTDTWGVIQTATFDESSAGESDVELFSVVFSPGGRLIAAGGGVGQRGYIAIWRVANEMDSKPVMVLKGHRGPVTAVAFSSLKPILVSGSMDGTIRLWDISGPEFHE